MPATIDDLLEALKKQVELQELHRAELEIIRKEMTEPPPPPAPPNPPKGFFGRMGKRIGNTRVGRAFKGGRTTIGRMLGGRGKSGTKGLGKFGKATGVAGGVVAGVVAVGMALNEFRKAVTKATEEQLRAARALAEVSPQMAAIFAQSDLQDTLRNMRKGEAQAESTQRLAESDQRRKSAMEPLENAVANFKNSILATLNDTIAPVLEGIGDAVEAILKKFDLAVPARGGAVGLAADMEVVRFEADRIAREGAEGRDAARAAVDRVMR